MAFIRTIYLYCDGDYETCEFPGEEFSEGESPFRTVAEGIKEAKTKGWHFVGTKAFCPVCWKNRKRI